MERRRHRGAAPPAALARLDQAFLASTARTASVNALRIWFQARSKHHPEPPFGTAYQIRRTAKIEDRSIESGAFPRPAPAASACFCWRPKSDMPAPAAEPRRASPPRQGRICEMGLAARKNPPRRGQQHQIVAWPRRANRDLVPGKPRPRSPVNGTTSPFEKKQKSRPAPLKPAEQDRISPPFANPGN